MPRTKLDPDYWILYGRDYLRRHTTQTEIAGILGISQQAVSKRVATMNFTIAEFRKIVKETGMAEETIMKIIGGG